MSFRSLSVGGANVVPFPRRTPDAAAAHREPLPVLIVLHQESSTPGRVGNALRALGHRLDIRRPRFGDPLPDTLEGHADLTTLAAVPVAANEARRAETVFREESAKTYTLDLGDLSSDRWSSPPSGKEFLAEVRTRRYGTLTYVRSPVQAEDISVFDRRNHVFGICITVDNDVSRDGQVQQPAAAAKLSDTQSQSPGNDI